jgi:hypothetical protein
MDDLASIAPATRTVALGRAAVEVGGLSLRKLTQLVAAYPDLIGFVAGGKIDVVNLLARGPEMALAIFAVGLVGPAQRRFWQRGQLRMSDDKMLAAFDKAAAGQQIDAIDAIVDLTFRGERAGPFLTSLLAALEKGAAAATSATSMPDSSSA